MDINTLTTEFLKMIPPDVWIIVAAIFGICFALKKSSLFPDRFIPLAALLFGVLFNVAAVAVFNRGFVVEAIVKGIVCGMAAVYVANVIKQAKKEE